MLSAAFGGVLGVNLTESYIGGIIFGITCALLLSTLHALLCIKFKVNQFVSGILLNIIAITTTSFLLRAIFKVAGATKAVKSESGVPMS